MSATAARRPDRMAGHGHGDMMDFDSISYFAAFAGTGTIVLVAALVAMLRERAQRQRRDLDRVSLVPWGLLSVLFLLLAIILLATAAKVYFAAES